MSEMDALFQKFQSAPREEVRLELALAGYFSGQASDAQKQALEGYLQRRLRPAMEVLLREGRLEELERLLAQDWFTPGLLEDGLTLAISLKSTEGFVLLLRRKAQLTGFSDRDFFPMTAGEKTRLCDQVLELTRQQLLDVLPQLGGALAALPWVPDERPGLRLVDGNARFRPDDLLRMYAAQPEALFRGYLHMLLHCLYLHPFDEHAGEPLWDAACDLAVERIIDGLNLPRLGKKPPILPELGDQNLTAQQIYGHLQENAPAFDPGPYAFDDHIAWKEAPGEEGRRKWEALLLAAAGARTGAGKRGRTPGGNQEEAEEAQAGQFDYRHYLERFASLREEMQLDMESFDYAYYRLGMELGTPFLEPLEYQEVRRLEELVIAIDTSGSCDKETVSRFLAEAWKILSAQENFFRKMNVYFLQCDCLIQDVTHIQSREDWLAYAKKVVIQGRGGTDFTPVFDYVETLRRTKQLKNLKALLYFTDGDGFYPTQPPDYDTAFVLLQDSGHPELVPKWAHCFQI